MVLLAKKFTPEVLITAPRRSPGSPSADGRYVLYSVSKYSLDSHSESKEVRVLDLKSGRTTLFTDDERFMEVAWLRGEDVVALKKEGGKGTGTEVWIGRGVGERSEYLAGIIPGPIFNFSTKELPNGSFAVVFNGKVGSDEDKPFNPDKAPKSHSSAREYTTSMVRYWDTYYTAERNTIWYTTLEKPSGSDQYKISESGFINALKGTGLTNPPFPPSLLDGKSLDVSTTGIVFTSLDPKVNVAKDLAFSLYYIPVDDFTKSATPRLVLPGAKRSVTSAVFSPNGKAVAFLASPPNDYSNTSIFIVGQVEDPTSVKELFDANATKEAWALKAQSIAWSNDAAELYVTAEDRGRGRLFKIPIKKSPATPLRPKPIALTDDGVVSSFYPLTNSALEKRLFINKTTLVDNGIFTVVDSSTGKSSTVSSASKHGLNLGLHSSQVSEITFKGDGDYDVQAWVMKPSNFSTDKTYPLALLIHGGPVSSWEESWSTRWNPAIYAEQGYVVVSPNPTGSTGFGQAFVDAIVGDWGGRPYNDIVACFEHVQKTMKYVDTNRTVALGASYGGYMMNWIAGQPLAKKLKAIVCHDGIFSIYSMLGSDSGALIQHDMGSNLWDDRTAWDKNDPAQHTDQWSTPMLIIHSDKDFRCPITEGLASYAVCQARGIESRFLNFPEENHFVLNRENSLLWHRTVLGWINHYAGVTDGVVLEPPVSQPRAG